MSHLIKTEELQQLKEIMEDEFAMLISLFVDDSEKLIKNMQMAYDVSDSDTLRIAAHTLKGSASNMCATDLTDICNELEDKAKDNDLQGVDTLLEKLKIIYPQTCEVLQAF
jgi:HPt (histidine-containing phosphotransfer) domain-containing protein